MSALSRRKGRRFELDVAKDLAPLYPEARPNLAQSRGTRRDGPDILGVPWWLECCHSAANKLAPKWAQAVEDNGASNVVYGPVVVICKRNRQDPLVLMHGRTAGIADAPIDMRVTMSLGDWIALLARRSRPSRGQRPGYSHRAGATRRRRRD